MNIYSIVEAINKLTKELREIKEILKEPTN